MQIDAVFCFCIDPWAEPHGGQARFAKQMLQAFGSRIAVAGVTKENLPLRRWLDRPFEGKTIKFLNMGKILVKNGVKPIIPLRLKVYNFARLSMPVIRSIGVKNIFIESPEVLFAAANYKWDSVCYRFAGVNNPIQNSRYKLARCLGVFFEKKMFLSLKKIGINLILASADRNSIDELVKRSNRLVDKRLIHQFPTRVDTHIFKPMRIEEKRKKLNLEMNKTIMVCCGRISWVKGWELLLHTMVILKKETDNFRLIFVGDGEDREKLIRKAEKLNIAKNIFITGFLPNSKVNDYLNAADLCVIASYMEGWSLAMLEMLACGKPVVSTDVSGANEMIHPGKNGFIVKQRTPEMFFEAIEKALKLRNAKDISLAISEQYSTKNIASDLESLWQPLSKK